jgi:hypothetical protein
MPTKFMKYKYEKHFNNQNLEKNQNNETLKFYFLNDNDSFSSDKSLAAKRKRDFLIETYGRDNVRFYGNSTILFDSEKYKLKRQLNNEASKQSKKRKEKREKLANTFIIIVIRLLIANKKKMEQEIDYLRKENEILNRNNHILNRDQN